MHKIHIATETAFKNGFEEGYEAGKQDAISYMEKQVRKHRISYEMQLNRGAKEEDLNNIKLKISYYEDAVEALKKVSRSTC